MNYSKKVSILGCGWVGLSLKESLEVKGYVVHCLLRDMALNISDNTYDVDILIIAIPPSTAYIFILYFIL